MRLFGRNPSIERLRSRPETIRRIYLEQGTHDAGYFHKKAKLNQIPVMVLSAARMEKLGRHTNAQGVMLDVDDFEYKDFGEILEEAYIKKWALIFLDQVTDPQNLGAILRSAGCFGSFVIVLTTHKSVSITESVLRVASGGENYVAVSMVSNLRKAIRQAKDRGFRIAGTTVKGGLPLETTRLPYPLGIVMGSEQKGVRAVVQEEIEINLTIPMRMDRMSFNVAQAATILCYEITRQRNIQKAIHVKG
jgi:23S rRNA (guanosine2251-2'-O)-methyltransferase